MRILHVNKFVYRRGGAESYLLDVADLQRAAGHEVDVWGMHHPANPPGLPLADTFASNIELEPPPPGALNKVKAGARMVWSPGSARGLARALAQFRPDVVHAHNIYHQLSPSILRATRQAGVPVVMTLHDYKLACPNYQLLDKGALCDACVTSGPWQAALHRCKDGSLGASALLAVESTIHRALTAYDGVARFIAPSRFLGDVMVRAKVHPDRVRVVNHFVETDVRGTGAESVQAWVAARGADPTVVFAGRLSHEKGVDTLVRAMGEVRSDVRLEIAGDGPLKGDLERLAEEVAPGRVTFLGRLAKSEVQDRVGRAVANVVPSQWHENQPMTILESFGLSTPVVCTDLGGMPELVRDGVEGRVVRPGDAAALAAAFDGLATGPAAAAALGMNGRRRAESDFSVPTHLGHLDRVYAEARQVLDDARLHAEQSRGGRR